MTDDELWDALTGLYSFDTTGCRCGCGIHDDGLKSKVREELSKDLGPGQLYNDRLTRLVRDRELSDEAIAKGYGLEDVRSLLDWIDNDLR